MTCAVTHTLQSRNTVFAMCDTDKPCQPKTEDSYIKSLFSLIQTVCRLLGSWVLWRSIGARHWPYCIGLPDQKDGPAVATHLRRAARPIRIADAATDDHLAEVDICDVWASHLGVGRALPVRAASMQPAMLSKRTSRLTRPGA